MESKKTYNFLCYNTGCTENVKNKDNILKYIEDFFKDENHKYPIAILQQIPYKIPNKYKNETLGWAIDPIYIEFENEIKKFINEEEPIMKNTDWYERIRMITVAITKNIHIDKLEKAPRTDILYPNADIFPRNRVIALNIGEKDKNELIHKFSILGLHAQAGYENILHLKSIPGVADIILGDFNAGNYEESDNKEVFRTLLSDTHVCIVNTPTKEVYGKRKTCIDHVFVKREHVTKVSNLIVHEDIKYSDHYPITFDFTI